MYGALFLPFLYCSIVSFTGKFLPNVNLRNMISTCTKDFSWEKKRPIFARFEDGFQYVATNIEGFYFFSTFISSM